jgi:hypothetical protein
VLARLLGLLLSLVPPVPRFGSGPNDRRLIPDVDSLAAGFADGVSSPPIDDPLAVLPVARFLLRIVTLGGMKFEPMLDIVRGEALGGVLTGAGSFDLADCTLCSSRCIWAVSVRMCVRELEFGIPLVGGALPFVFRMTDGVAFLPREVLAGIDDPGPLELRKLEDWYIRPGLGVVLESAVGSFDLLFGGFIGVFATVLAVEEASDIGGEGGVGVSETVSVVETDLVSGGVVIMGEDAVDVGEPAREGELGALRSVAMASWRFSSLPFMISASIFKSDSSSRNRCVSILRFSRSCSLSLISSSIMTPRSIATLNLDSMSSSDEVVLRACLSKSSFATSISRNLSCNVRLVSRSVVISFCKRFCAAFASFLDCLYLACTRSSQRQ